MRILRILMPIDNVLQQEEEFVTISPSLDSFIAIFRLPPVKFSVLKKHDHWCGITSFSCLTSSHPVKFSHI